MHLPGQPDDVWQFLTRERCVREQGSMPTSAGSLTRVMDFSLSSMPVSIVDSSGT